MIEVNKRIRIEFELAQGLNSIFIKNKFRVIYGLGECEFKPLAVKLMDMNWSWPPIIRGFLRSLGHL